MPRVPRRIVGGGFYHVLNRANGRMRLFYKDADYAAFVHVLYEGLRRSDVDLFAWCLMPNHWHLVVRPGKADALADLMRWIGVTHVRRHHEHYNTRGGGHLYQGRFKSFPVQDDRHFLTLCRYVESNPVRGRRPLAARAELWPWSSLGCVDREPRLALAGWPMRRPAREAWRSLVNEPLAEREMARLSASVVRGQPFGEAAWMERTARRQGLLSSLRPIGRPAKAATGSREKGK